MEDSGRDKLKGQDVNASVSNPASDDKDKNNDVDFHSEKINKKQKEEHFKNVAGAEERAKATEKAKAEAKKAAEKAQDERVLQYLEDEKREKHSNRKISRGVIIAIVAVVALLIGVGIFLAIKLTRKPVQSNEEYALEILENAKQVSGFYESESDYYMGLEVFQQAKESTSDRVKLAYIEVAEADYSGNAYGKFKYARELLDKEEVQENEELINSCFYQEIDYKISILEANWPRVREIRSGECIEDEVRE